MEVESLSPGETKAGTGAGEHRRNGGKRRIAVFLVVGLLCVGLLALLGSQILAPAQGQTNPGSSPLLGHPAPDFTLATLSSHPAPAVHLAGLKGKQVMLNFWASWCDACKQEAALLQTTWQRVQAQGVVFRTFGVTYPNVVEPNGSVTINYGVTGVPETFFHDRHGVVVQKVIGELTEQTLQSNLQAILRST